MSLREKRQGSQALWSSGALADQVGFQPPPRLVGVHHCPYDLVMVETVDPVCRRPEGIDAVADRHRYRHPFGVDIDPEVLLISVHLQRIERGLGLLD